MGNGANLFAYNAFLKKELKERLQKRDSHVFDDSADILFTRDNSVDFTHSKKSNSVFSEVRVLKNADLIITPHEICYRHGTGIILSRIFGEKTNIFSIRSTSFYPEHQLGEIQMVISHEEKSRSAIFRKVLEAIGQHEIKRILCVPFYPDDLHTAIAAKEISGAPLCLFLMDDQNIYHHSISDELMREAIEKSSLRLVISPEFREAYEHKYGVKFWLLPPVAPSFMVREKTISRSSEEDANTGVLVGNIWNESTFQALRETVKNTGEKIDWYGNAGNPFIKFDQQELKDEGIHFKGYLSEEELIPLLSNYSYSIIPGGSLSATDSSRWLPLSLPTRLITLMATSHIPFIVLGDENIAPARFVKRMGIGFNCPYNSAAFKEVVSKICADEMQVHFRNNAARISKNFSDQKIAEWIWSSTEKGSPIDDRFEKIMPRSEDCSTPWINSKPPSSIYWEYQPVYSTLERLTNLGFKPDFVLDVGCSSGIWSSVAYPFFKEARFILIDPLLAPYREENPYFVKNFPSFEWMEMALADYQGEITFYVHKDFYGSSIFKDRYQHEYIEKIVPVSTLNLIAKEKNLSGNGFLKIDAQSAEHLILKGASDLLPQIDCILLELSLYSEKSESKNFLEMLRLLDDLGYEYLDDAGSWRSPKNGRLNEKDVLFARKGFFKVTP